LNPSQEDNFGVDENSPKVLPTVFKWNGGGKQVYITGTFSNWKTIPMVKRYIVLLIKDYIIKHNKCIQP
jgi:Glycogen recognition site of AMP-activated protein kinase